MPGADPRASPGLSELQTPAGHATATAPAGAAAGPAAQSIAGQSLVGQSLAGQSIAAQIDDILQARLQNTPLAGRGIQLVELPGQGLVVKVGQAQYTDLTQVPGEPVRAAIAAAVAE